MNIANGPVRPLPTNLNPPLDFCVRLNLPNDPEWVAAFFDAVYQLTYWFAWDRDNAHSGKVVAALWLRVLDGLRPCLPAPSADGCCDDPIGETNLIRQNPDNPCEIQTSADGTHWCTVVDLSLCLPASGQPGGGSQQPHSGGGCVTYHAANQAPYQWYLPTVCNTGDTITVSNLQGAAEDGTGTIWYCPDGKRFFAGSCLDDLPGYPDDPKPSANHMSIVFQIAGTWYSAAAPVTVPGGVSSAQVLFQLNDANLGDNQGSYNFDVEVCNNTAGTYTHVFDFALSNHGWTRHTDDLISAGDWVPGSGWIGTLGTDIGGNRRLAMYIKPPITTFDYTTFTVIYDEDTGQVNSPADLLIETNHSERSPLDSGVNQNWTYSGTYHAAGDFWLYFTASRHNPGDPSPTGSNRVSKITISGPGADPF